MGSCVSGRSKKNNTQEKDLLIVRNSSKNDSLFNKIEINLVFPLIKLPEFLTLLFYSFVSNPKGIKEEHFILFIDYKLLKNPLISDVTMNNQTLFDKLKIFSQYLFKSLSLSFKTLYKRVFNVKYEEHELPIYVLVALGVAYCESTYKNKIEIIFNILANASGKIEKNEKTQLFIYCLFDIPSNGVLYAMKLASEEDGNFKLHLDENQFAEVYDGYQVKDAMFCSDFVLNLIFEKKSCLDFDEFFSLMANSSIMQNLLYSNGLRFLIDNHNI